jgi:hypothetical protein
LDGSWSLVGVLALLEDELVVDVWLLLVDELDEQSLLELQSYQLHHRMEHFRANRKRGAQG